MNGLFYATKDDLLAVTDYVESVARVKYISCESINKPPPKSFDSAHQVPDLGKASTSAGGWANFLVCDPHTIIKPEPGKDRFLINQLINPDTITLSTGGFWNDDILLHGRVATASSSEASKALLKIFKTALRKKFVTVKAFQVGPQALEHLKNGKRLTIAVQSPPEFDLTID